LENSGIILFTMKKPYSILFEFAKLIILALLIVVPVRYFLFQPFIVRGASMEPSFYEGDYLLIDQLSYYFRDPERGEVVVFRYPEDPARRYIKRVIGLPGEEVVLTEEEIIIENEEGTVVLEEDYIRPSSLSDMSVGLGEEEYFMVGDNRGFSFDSRSWGPVEKEEIVGRVFFQISPLRSTFAQVETPDY